MRYLLPLLGLCLGTVVSIAQPAIGLPSLSTSTTAISTSLDLDGEGSASMHIVKIADISISTDYSSGLTLMLTSGSLTKVDGSDILFKITTVANDESAPSSSAFDVPSGDTYTYSTQAAGSENRDVYILYTPSALQDPGSYGATINISVFDN
ncbi:hypothetical protein IQ273_01930 [Nodosilinea sp. LEGE 07298]|uniref:hypothetical protein n=1 Tax=Nodosilinea sp. LEGE 07298 TaxID=2777970 RepID=UPI001882CE17|nr:hypothetical protein [Nodosilinea sp. LEGE 07298]MBE9108179.1 hypothetical protein [Nodosilinea sp. LEGE 07298]